MYNAFCWLLGGVDQINVVQDLTSNLSLPENEIPAQVSKADLRHENRTAANCKNIAEELYRLLPENLQHARLVARHVRNERQAG